MGTFLSMDEGKRILLIQFEGVVTDDVLVKGYQRVRFWFAQNGYCGNISDFSNVSSFEVTGSAIGMLALNPPLVPENYVRILVAPQDEVYGMSRMFAMMSSDRGNRVDIVRNMEEAYQMAGIECPNFRPIDAPEVEA